MLPYLAAILWHGSKFLTLLQCVVLTSVHAPFRFHFSNPATAAAFSALRFDRINLSMSCKDIKIILLWQPLLSTAESALPGVQHIYLGDGKRQVSCGSTHMTWSMQWSLDGSRPLLMGGYMPKASMSLSFQR